MIQGTTPTIRVNVKSQNVNLSLCSKIRITVVQGETVLKLDSPRVTATKNQALVELTQEETLGFNPGVALVQMRWLTADGKAEASRIGKITVYESLDKEAMDG